MIKFVANTNIIVVGPTSSGKTTTVLNILKQRLIEPFPPNIIYLFGARQQFMDTWNHIEGNPKIHFHEGLQLEILDKYKTPKVLIIDDLMLEQSKALTQHFLSGSHHKQTTTIYIAHKIYMNDENYRLLSNNAQYFIIMKNKRNRSELLTLARQILGEEASRVLDAYKTINSRPYGSVLLSLANQVPEELIVSIDWLTPCPTVFL